MVTVVVIVNPGHGGDAKILYVIIQVPGVLVEGVIAPVKGFIDNPAGALKLPPCDPVSCGNVIELDMQIPAG